MNCQTIESILGSIRFAEVSALAGMTGRFAVCAVRRYEPANALPSDLVQPARAGAQWNVVEVVTDDPPCSAVPPACYTPDTPARGTGG